MNSTTKYVIFVIVAITVSFLFLKPIVTHKHEFKVVIVNTSEKPIANTTIYAEGMPPREMKTIRIGHMQDYIFLPAQSGPLRYSMTLGKRQFDGIINANLKKGETGDVYVVVGELQKIRVFDEYDSAY